MTAVLKLVGPINTSSTFQSPLYTGAGSLLSIQVTKTSLAFSLFCVQTSICLSISVCLIQTGLLPSSHLQNVCYRPLHRLTSCLCRDSVPCFITSPTESKHKGLNIKHPCPLNSPRLVRYASISLDDSLKNNICSIYMPFLLLIATLTCKTTFSCFCSAHSVPDNYSNKHKRRTDVSLLQGPS